MEEAKQPKPKIDLPASEKETPKQSENLKKSNILKSKYFILFVIFLVIIAFLIGGLALGRNYSKKQISQTITITQSPTPASEVALGWKTYANSKYNYSIDYPGNWYNREFSDEKTGSAFTKSSKPNDYTSESITINVNNKTLNDYGVPFETYVKTAATHEIQNYKSLASIKKITTDGGIVGYETTWKVQSIGPGGTGDSLPRTYFAIPNNDKASIQVELSKEEDLAIYEKMLTTFKITGQTQNQNQESVLKIPEYGVQITLSDEIKDAYYLNSTASKGYVYLKVHSLDSEPKCMSDDSSTAALSKVGKDDVNEMSGKKYSDSYDGVTIGNYFYYIDLAQYICAEKPENQTKLDNIRKAFSNASSTIKAL